MTVNSWLEAAHNSLKMTGISTARLDALVLLEDVTSIDRAKLLAESDTILSSAQIGKLKKLLKARLDHKPLAYIRGFAEFYGHNFIISPATLVPRPESEAIVDILIELMPGLENPFIADVGSGSGALGITAKIIYPKASIDLLEISDEAIEIAKQNIAKHKVSVNVIKSDLLESSEKNYDVLLCNLPYVPDAYEINQAAKHEPKIAIFGGKDGLVLYKRMFKQVSALKIKPQFIIAESLPEQHSKMTSLGNKAGYKSIKEVSFVQLFKLDDLIAPV